MENKRKLQEFFLANFCREYPCGSQRCDGSEECLDGCRKYQELRKTVEGKLEELKKD